MRALIIDDSRTMRTIVGRIIRDLGFETAEASNGQEGLTRLEEIGPTELILVDWNMPDMNGYEFVTATRANPVYDKSQIVMVTTESQLSQISKALDAGANEYVIKPFTKEILKDKLVMLGIVS